MQHLIVTALFACLTTSAVLQSVAATHDTHTRENLKTCCAHIPQTQRSQNFPDSPPPSTFVKTQGTQLVLDNQPYYFIGANFWYGAYLGADADYGKRDRLIRELDRLHALGVDNLRIAASSEESVFSKPLTPPFQYRNGEYNETLFEGLDFLLVEMAKRNMKAVLFLNNYWDWTGGMAQYVSWATGQQILDPTSNPDLGWDDYIGFSGQFYGSDTAQVIYRRYINEIVTRVNSYSKVAYRDDPTIMAWQLANEPRPNPIGDRVENVVLFAKWVDASAGYIKTLDPNHLVSIGSEGSKGSLNSLDYAYHIQKSPNIDYFTYHMWPKNWGWFDPAQPDSLRNSLENAQAYIEEHNALAVRLGKPAVIEEFGLNRDSGYFPNTSVTSRDKFYAFIFQTVQSSMDSSAALVGCNFWAWGGEGRGQHQDAIYQNGDLNYVGDPYAEHQGLNSVFDADSTTLAVIKQYTRALSSK